MKGVIGIDYGTDSVRACLIDAETGGEISQSVHHYQRWGEGKYCDPAKNQFRQHPADYLEGLEMTIRDCVANSGGISPSDIKGIGIDTTGSTPVATDKHGTPLALLPEFSQNPNAMFILWKDHIAIDEAEEINHISRTWGGPDYTKYIGGIYSSEWFWAKILHTIREDKAVAEAAYSWMEHCDWIPAVLTGMHDIKKIKRSRCAAGHKAMWHRKWNGLPPKDYFRKFDDRLADLRDRLYEKTYTADIPAGTLCKEWSDRLNLPEDVVISVGTFDAHAGGVGAQIEPHCLVKVMGTSTCDMMVATPDELGDKVVNGICGQVEGSIIPDMIGLEAGQSAFGDLLAWFRDLIAWPIAQSKDIPAPIKNKIAEEMIEKLTLEAQKIPPGRHGVVSLDWVNGRRTPDANQALKGAVMGLNMGTDAPVIFRSLVESICFGSRQIVERFRQEGLTIHEVIGVGGVAKKSPFVMQTLADVLNMPIKIARSDQVPSLGAAMLAATAAGIYTSVTAAKKAMGSGFDNTFNPNNSHVKIYNQIYQKYRQFGIFVESDINSANE